MGKRFKMGKKKSRKFKMSLTAEQARNMIPEGGYMCFNQSEAIELGLMPTGMTNVNTVVLGASGSYDGNHMFFANYYRVDGTMIDQDTYYEAYFNRSEDPVDYGMLLHQDYEKRTTDITNEAMDIITSFGVTADFHFTTKPAYDTGWLEDLRDEGKLQGFDNAWKKGWDYARNRPAE